MSLKEYIEQRKQRLEAKSYFNQNNSEIIRFVDYLRVFGLAVLITIVGLFIQLQISKLIGIHINFIGFIVGYGVAKLFEKRGLGVVIVAFVGCVLGSYITTLLIAILEGLYFDLDVIFYFIKLALSFNIDNITIYVMAFLGCYLFLRK